MVNQVFSPLWPLLLIAFALAVLAGIVKSPWFKGIAGEVKVNLLLKLCLPKDKYHLMKDVTLPVEGWPNQPLDIDGTTQIDHILVSKYGVFVIETKNMKGWIFGSPDQKQWTQKIYRHSSRFQNPLRQNYKHLKAFEACLGVRPDSLFSLIVFTGSCSFKTEMPENVTHAGGCVGFPIFRTIAK